MQIWMLGTRFSDVRVFYRLTCDGDGSGAEGGLEEVEIRRAGLDLFMLSDSCA